MTAPACLTLREVADLKGVGYYCALAAVTSGSLAAHHKPGNPRKWYVTRADAEAWQPGRRGDPGPLLDWHRKQGNRVSSDPAQPEDVLLIRKDGSLTAVWADRDPSGNRASELDFGDFRARLDKRTPVYREISP